MLYGFASRAMEIYPVADMLAQNIESADEPGPGSFLAVWASYAGGSRSVAAIPTRSRRVRSKSLFPPQPSVSCVSVPLARHPIEYLNGETGYSVRGYSIVAGGNRFHLLDRRVYAKMLRSTALPSTK